MNLLDVIEDTTHRVIVYGAPKTGKTELVGRLSEKFKLLWIDCEKGYATLAKLPKTWQKNVELITLPDTREYPIAIETVLKIFKGGEVSICEAHGKVSCPLCKKDNKPVTMINLSTLGNDTIVVLDSLTQVSSSAMASITKNQSDDYKIDWDDYTKQGVLMTKLLSNMQQATYNLCVITHELEVELEDGRKKLVPASGTTNFSRNTAKYFDHVIYAQVLNKKHSFGSSTTYGVSLVTGSRTDIVIEGKVVPTLFDIFTTTSKSVANTVTDFVKSSETEEIDTNLKTTIVTNKEAVKAVVAKSHLELLREKAKASIAPVISQLGVNENE